MNTSLTGPKLTFWFYVDQAKEWRWRLVAGNNEPIADSAEGYKNKQDCLKGIALVRKSALAAVKQYVG